MTLTPLVSSSQSWVLENNGDSHVQKNDLPPGLRWRASSTPTGPLTPPLSRGASPSILAHWWACRGGAGWRWAS